LRETMRKMDRSADAPGLAEWGLVIRRDGRWGRGHGAGMLEFSSSRLAGAVIVSRGPVPRLWLEVD
jgi:hypothetical protein